MISINKWAVFDSEFTDYTVEPPKTQMVFDPHDGQLQIMESPARFKVCSCGRRFGKSYIGGHELIPCALLAAKMRNYLKSENKRHEYWCIGPEYVDAEKEFRVFYNKAKALGMEFDKPGTYYSLQTGDMVVSLWDGAFIFQAKSEARPTSLVGEALSGVIMAEAAKQKESTWTQLIRPALADMTGWALFTTTPEGKNWFYRLYLDAVKGGDDNKSWAGFKMPTWYNSKIPGFVPTVDEHVKRLMHLSNEHPEYTAFEIARAEKLVIGEEILQMANDLTIPMFQQEVAAEFTDFVGKVFKEYDEETHSRFLPYNRSSNWNTVAAVDYGYRNPNVWLLIQIGPWGEINIIDELYQDSLAPEEFANEILRRGLCPDSCAEFYPDPALPGYTATLENVFRKAGKRVKARSGTGGELVDRLNLIRLALKQRITDHELSAPEWRDGTAAKRGSDHKRPRMMISTKCPMTLYEMGEYRYPEKKDENMETSIKRFELPLKKDDHTPEAIGRFLAGMYHSVQDQFGGGTRITKANFLNGMNGRGWSGGYGAQPAGVPTRKLGATRAPWMS